MGSMNDEDSKLYSDDLVGAADTLVFLKRQKLSNDEARQLENLTAERDVHHHYQRRSRNSREEEIMNSTVPENLTAERDVHHHHHHQGRSRNNREEETMNSTVPEDFPVPSLRQFVKNCSIIAIEKQLTSTDTKDEHNRLNLVKCLVEQFFLPMLNEDENLQRGIPVMTYDEKGNEYAMKFVFWSKKYYVLNGGWKRFCKQRGLRQLEDYVQVWMFRHSQTDKLCFVITHRRKPLLQPLRIKG